MQNLYRPQGEYQPKRSYGAMITAALIIGGLGLLGAAAATGNLSIGSNQEAKTAAQSKSELSQAEAPAPAADPGKASEQLASAEPASTPPSQPSIAPDTAPKDTAAKTAPEAAHEAPPVAKKPAPKAAVAKPTSASEKTGNDLAACSNCGAVESIKVVKSGDNAPAQNAPDAAANDGTQADNAQAVSYRIQIRMVDGSLRTVVQDQAPAVAQGDRVKIVDGMVVHGS